MKALLINKLIKYYQIKNFDNTKNKFLPIIYLHVIAMYNTKRKISSWKMSHIKTDHPPLSYFQK